MNFEASTWLATSNRKTFMNLTAFQRNSIVGMNPCDATRTFPSPLTLVRGSEMIIHTGHTTNLTLKVRSSAMLTFKTQIRLQLSIF